LARAAGPGAADSSELKAVQEWLAGDGWDDLLTQSGELQLLNIKRLAEYEFTDKQLKQVFGLPRTAKVSDAQRVQYARQKVADFASGEDGFFCPSVAIYPLDTAQAASRTSALLGGVIEIHGQAGPVVNWHGLFSTQEAFDDDLRLRGFTPLVPYGQLEDRELLSWWQR
jgi:hypothetical protein